MKQIDIKDLYNSDISDNDYCRIRVGKLKEIIGIHSKFQLEADNNRLRKFIRSLLDDKKRLDEQLAKTYQKIEELQEMELQQFRRAINAESRFIDCSLDIRG